MPQLEGGEAQAGGDFQDFKGHSHRGMVFTSVPRVFVPLDFHTWPQSREPAMARERRGRELPGELSSSSTGKCGDPAGGSRVPGDPLGSGRDVPTAYPRAKVVSPPQVRRRFG